MPFKFLTSWLNRHLVISGITLKRMFLNYIGVPIMSAIKTSAISESVEKKRPEPFYQLRSPS